MADRATYLARALLTRLRSAAAWSQGDSAEETAADAPGPAELVAKVLAVETGVTDGLTVGRVVNALPRISAEAPPTDRDLAQLAEALRVAIPDLATGR